MNNSDLSFSKNSFTGRGVVFSSIALIFMLAITMFFISRDKTQFAKDELIVYCAAAIRLPIKEISNRYSRRYGVDVRLEYSSSGELEGKLQQDANFAKSRAHLYIPADTSFANRTREKQLTVEQLPLAGFRLVLAIKADEPLEIKSIRQLIDSKVAFAVCNTYAGAGKQTKTTLEAQGLWQDIVQNRKVEYANVTECANAIKMSDDIQAGFIWDTTAKQFGLKIVNITELKSASSTITVNITSQCPDSAAALGLARFLSAPENAPSFKKFGFDPHSGDPWVEKPNLIFYCDGVNKNAITKTLKDFEIREGLRIQPTYAGCDTLVTEILSIGSKGQKKMTFPDAFMTCDKTYFDKVENLFTTPEDISSNSIVILTRKGNNKNIKSLTDLSREGLKVGVANPQKSTLGYLSWKMFTSLGVSETIKNNAIVTAPTADELIDQFLADEKLDAVLVYRANWVQIEQDCELIAINHNLAKTIQNVCISKQTESPLIMKRFIEALKSNKSQMRFENSGFEWVYQRAQ